MARILVIDDDLSVRLAIRKTLQMEGHEIEEAIDGQSGVELYRKNPPDLVMTDIVMPGKHGLEVIEELRRDYPDAKIIALSGSGVEDLKRSTSLGANYAMEKPFLTRELLRVVRETLED